MMEKPQKVDKEIIKISLEKYLQADKTISERSAFAFGKSFAQEVDRSFEEWQKFFQDK